MKQFLKNIGWIICAGFVFAGFGVSSVMAQPVPHHMDPKLNDPRIDRPIDPAHDVVLNPHHKGDNSKKEDEIKAEHELHHTPVQPSHTPVVKPVEPDPHVLPPVPEQKQPVIAGPDKIKPANSQACCRPLSANHSSSKLQRPVEQKVHVSGKKPVKPVAHGHVMNKGVLANPHAHVVKTESREMEVINKYKACMSKCARSFGPDGTPFTSDVCQKRCHDKK